MIGKNKIDTSKWESIKLITTVKGGDPRYMSLWSGFKSEKELKDFIKEQRKKGMNVRMR